jgi:riboflavin biosynthesis pyrimidine reductase
VFDRLRDALSRTNRHPASADELDAALSVVVLAMFADRRLAEAEAEEVERWIAEHEGDDEARSLAQRVPTVMAGVRRALDQDPGGEVLLAEADGRITHTELRAELPEICRAVIGADRTIAPEETQLLERITQRFS